MDLRIGDIYNIVVSDYRYETRYDDIKYLGEGHSGFVAAPYTLREFHIFDRGEEAAPGRFVLVRHGQLLEAV